MDLRAETASLSPVGPEEIDAVLSQAGREPEDVIAVLQAIQARYHYLPPRALRLVVDRSQMTAQDVMGVATFYEQFRTTPAGRHRVRVCIGTACHVKGAEPIFDAFRARLGIPPGEDTDPDGLFTVEKVPCLGCCMLAPAVQIDEITYGFLTPERVPGVLAEFLAAPSSTLARGTPVPDPGVSLGRAGTCLCSSCDAAGGGEVFREMERCARALDLPVKIQAVGCTGISYLAPFVDVNLEDGKTFQYGAIQPCNVSRLLLRHFSPGGLALRLKARAQRLLETFLGEGFSHPVHRNLVDAQGGPDAPYLSPQVRIATEHAGRLDPLDLHAYRAHGGFEALDLCRTLPPEEVIRRVTQAGLRGRGGAGYPTGKKWLAVMKEKGERKTVVLNGDEGDPGAFMDRCLLESFPFRVIEGMAIAAYAVGAQEGMLYVRAEYPLAARRLREALDRCGEEGLLQSGEAEGPGLTLRVVDGAGAFVCGEETALIAALEGKRGMPRRRPPWPAQKGYKGRPTLVNNVETCALLPWILREGPEAFEALGTDRSPGTKTFALAGKIQRGGLIEVPMGIPLSSVVHDIGGGMEGGRSFKAVQVGGPSGGCVPASLSDTEVDFEALAETGSMMGSGGLVVLDETDCAVEVARYFLAFTQRESCGKCTFCRIGTKRMLEILERITGGKGRPGDLEELVHLGEKVRAGSLCGLGRTAPNPVLSTLTHFRSEYEAHLEGRCPAGVCRELITFTISERCIGCTRCAQHCPVDAIPMTPHRRHVIDSEVCVRCGTCRRVCPEQAVVTT